MTLKHFCICAGLEAEVNNMEIINKVKSIVHCGRLLSTSMADASYIKKFGHMVENEEFSLTVNTEGYVL